MVYIFRNIDFISIGIKYIKSSSESFHLERETGMDRDTRFILKNLPPVFYKELYKCCSIRKTFGPLKCEIGLIDDKRAEVELLFRH